tara:strand:+ start:382 stop:666 length:285 start_codon:yes stop_codon:yes gene_type:complete
MASSATTRIAHYVYAAADGEMRSTMKSIVAPSYERAIEEASEKAPAEEFDVSVHAEREDQFLGSERHQAADMSEQTIDPRIVELLYDDGGTGEE